MRVFPRACGVWKFAPREQLASDIIVYARYGSIHSAQPADSQASSADHLVCKQVDGGWTDGLNRKHQHQEIGNSRWTAVWRRQERKPLDNKGHSL